MSSDIYRALRLMYVLLFILLLVSIFDLYYQNWKQQKALDLIAPIVPIVVKAHPPKSKQVKSLKWDKRRPAGMPVLEEPINPSLRMYHDRNAISGGE